MSVIGTVSHLIGRAVAIKSDGTERILALGDQVYADEMVRVAPDASIEIAMDSGDLVKLDGGQNWLASSETYLESDSFDTSEAAADAESIQAAILAGADPTDVAEETAAGGEQAVTGNEGSTTVNIQRTAEEVDPSAGYETTGFGQGDTEQPIYDGDEIVLVQPVISISGPSTVVEGEIATYTIRVSQPVLTDMTISVVTGHVTTDDGDLVPVSMDVTIPAGQSSVSFDVQTNDDYFADSGEQYSVFFDTIVGGGYENIALDGSSVTTTILDQVGSDNPPGDEDTVVLNVEGPDTVVEGEVATYTVTVSNPPLTDLVISVVTGHITTEDGDFVPVRSDVTIAAGTVSTTFDVVTTDDSYADNGEQFSVSITGSTGGGYENLVVGGGSVTTTIEDQVGSDNPPGDEDTATVSLTGPSSVIEGETTTPYTVTVDQPAVSVTTPITVTFTYSGVAKDGEDFTGQASVEIPAGSNTKTFTIATLDDVLAEGVESFTVTIDTITDTNFEHITEDATNNSVETQILDDADPTTTEPDTETATVSLTGPATVIEGETTAPYTISVDQPADDVVTPITVTFTYSGVAKDGEDFTGQGTIDIPAGSNSNTFTIATLDDVLAEGVESFTVTIDTITDTNFEHITEDATNGSVETQILDDANPTTTEPDTETATVSLTGPSSVVEGDVTTPYTISVDQPAADVTAPITVTFTYSGVAKDGEDFTGQGTIDIPAGSNSNTFTIGTFDDALAEGAESFTITIDSITDTNFEHIAEDATNNSVETTIIDNDGATVSLTGPSSVIEGETTAPYTISVDQPAASVTTPITVTFTYSGVAKDGEDFTGQGSVDIPAGSNSNTFTIATLDDVLAEGVESFTVTISGITDTNYPAIGADTVNNSVETQILDDANPTTTEPDTETATVSLTGPTSVIEGNTTTPYTVAVDQPAADITTPITVTFTYSGVAVDGTDFTGVGTVEIPAGSNSNTFTIATLDDVLAEGAESFTIAIDSITDTNFEHIAEDATNNRVETQILDDTDPATTEPDTETATVSLTGPTSVIEGNTTTPYTISVDQPAGDVTTPITVTFTYSGVAVDGTDFTGVGTVEIPAGSNSNTFTIATLDDVLAEGAESFTIAIDSITDSNFEHIAEDATNNSVETQILDDTDPATTEPDTETATVSLTGPTSVIEGNTTTPYTISVDQPAGDVTTPITVTFTYSGVAVDGTDFTGVGTVEIPAGSNSNTFTIATLDDVLAEGAESFTIAIDSITDTNFEHITEDATNNRVETQILDDTDPTTTEPDTETAYVSIAGPSSVVEGNTTTPYTVAVDQPAADITTPITVTFTYSGVAVDGTDFTGVGTVEIPAGSNSTTFTIATLDDVLAEGAESFTIAIDSITDTNFEHIAEDATNNSVETTIIDNDGATVSLTGPGSVIEGDTTTPYTISVDQPAASVTTPITVSFTYSGVAVDGTDFTGVGSVDIPAGQNSNTFTIATLDDVLAEGVESFTVTISGITDTNYPAIGADTANNSVETQILDDANPTTTEPDTETATVSLTGPTSVIEGNTTTPYTVAVDQPAADITTPITVTFTYSGVAVDGTDFTGVGTVEIPAGSNSNTFTIATLDDVLAEGAESFTVTIDTITDTNFEHITEDATNNSVETQILDDTDPSTTEPDTETATVSLTGPSSVVEGTTTAPYTVSVDQPAADVTAPITVTFTYSGVAKDGEDFTGQGTIDIPAGSNSNTFTIATLDDVLAEGVESFTVTIDTITDTNFEHITEDATNNSVETQILDDTDPSTTEPDTETATVSLTGPATVIEGETTAPYTISVDQPAADVAAPITVTFTYSGVAKDGEDFTGQGSVDIPAGSNSNTFTIATLDDVLAEGVESFTVTIDTITDTNFEHITEDATNNSVETQILDDADPTTTEPDTETATVSLTGPSSVVEGDVTTPYTISVDQPAADVAAPITVTFTYSGVAKDGEDFTGQGTIDIPAGSNSNTFTIGTFDDALAEGAESFTITIDSITDTNFEHIAEDATNNSVETTIIDNDGATVSLTGPSSVIEGETTAPYTISVDQPAASVTTPITVTFTYSGVAKDGEDFTGQGSVDIPAGSNSNTFTIATLDDVLAEGVESFTVTISGITDTNYPAIGADTANNSVETQILDDANPTTTEPDTETATVSLTGPTSVIEGNTTTPYTVAVDQPAADITTPITVSFTYSGVAVDGTDFTGVGSVDIPAGQNSNTFTIATLDDVLAEGAESFTIAIDSITDTNFEHIAEDATNNRVETQILDDTDPATTEPDTETATVSLTGPTSVIEGNTTTPYTISVDQPAGDVTTPITVTFTYSGVAVDGTDFTGVGTVEIPAGSNSNTFTIATLDDVLAEGAESFTIAIDSITDSNFEHIAEDATNNRVETQILDDTDPATTEPDTETATVSLTGPTSVIEGNTTTPYTISVDQPAGDVTTPITVTFTYSGVAVDGTDFTGVGTVEIPAGSNSNTFTIATLDDVLAEGAESFTIAIDSITDTNFEHITEDATNNRVETQILDDADPTTTEPDTETATVSLTGPSSVVEGTTTTPYTISVDQPAADVTAPITVTFTYSGVAKDGEDFTGVGTVEIPAGSNSTTFTIGTFDDALAEGAESFTITIDSITDTNFEHIAEDATNNSVETTIIDNDGATVSLTGPSSVIEGETTAPYTISVDQPAASVTTPITVSFTYSGVAVDGTDFTGVGSVDIPAGQNSNTFTIATLDDVLAEGVESFTVTISGITDTNYPAIGADTANNSVETQILDDADPSTTEPDTETATVSLTGPATVVEGETTAPYTISVDQPAADVTAPITVTFTYSGVAKDGEDFTGQGTIDIPAGSNSNTFTIATLDDVLAEGAESFTVTIDTITDTNFEHITEDATNNSVETEITDNDHVPVAVDDPDGGVIEGGLASEYYGYREGIDGGNLTSLQQVKDYVAANEAEITFTSTQINYGYTDTNANNRYDSGEVVGTGDLADDVAASGSAPSNLEWFLKQDAASIQGTSTQEATDGVIHMSGLIDIPADGTYTFDVQHDDGFVIYIDGVDIFEYDAITSPTESIKSVDLTGGQHTVEVFYWDQAGDYVFDLQLLDSNDNNIWVTENLSTPVSAPFVTNEETPILIDLDDNDFDVDGDLDPASIVIQSNPGNGSVVVHGDGTVTYTPNSDFYGVDTFTYTIKDLAGHESNVATVTVAVNSINDIPQLSVQGPLSLSEEAIPLIGALETDDGADTSTASGVLSIIDPDNSNFAISLTGPAGVESDGAPVDWTWVADTDDSNSIQGVLTGTNSVTGQDVATVTLQDTVDNGNGNYSATYDVSLLAGIDHENANGENNETLTFEATVSDGLSAPQSVNFVVNVEDDTVNGFDINQSLVGEQDTITTNLVLVLDRSGSMADDFYNDGLYYLEIARDALKQLIDSADGAGNVNVMIVDFSSNTDSSGWVVDDVAAAYEYLDNLIASGGTEYDTALNTVMSEYQLTTPPPADQTFTYFVTDGVPNNSHGVDSSVTYTPEGSSSSLSGTAAWEAFLDDSGITESYAIGIGNVLSNSSSAINHLNDVAHSTDAAYVDANNSNTAEENTILLSDPNDLANALLEAFSNDSISGTVESTLGAAGDSGFILGADGGQVTSITINGVVYSYDPDTQVMSADPSTVSLAGLVSGTSNEILTVETDIGGDMMLNFITGEYSYNIVVTTSLLGSQELFDIQAIDNDGDTATLAMKLDLDFTAQLDANRDNVITNIADGSPVVIPEIAILHNDQEDGGTITSVDNALGGIVNDTGDIIFTRGGGLSEGDFSTSTAAAIITEDESASPNNSMANAVDMTDRGLFSSNNSNLSGLNQSGYAAAFIGQLSSSSDEDWFEITLAEGESIHFDIDNASINTNVSVYDSMGNFVTTIGENNGSAYDDYTANTSGNYFVKVDSPNNGVGSYELYMAINTANAEYSDASFEYTLGTPSAANTDSTIVDINTVSGNSLVGTEFDDILLAGTGDDTLSAGDGDDVLIGGEGNDILTGGAGEDLFVWSKSDLGTGSVPAVDQITDFNTAENDVIDLSDVLSDGSHTLDAVMNAGHLQLTITDSSSNEVVQRVDVNNLSVSNDVEAQNLLTTLLTSNNIDDGIV